MNRMFLSLFLVVALAGCIGAGQGSIDADATQQVGTESPLGATSGIGDATSPPASSEDDETMRDSWVDEVVLRYVEGARTVRVLVHESTGVEVLAANHRLRDGGVFVERGEDWACGRSQVEHVQGGESRPVHDFSWAESNGRLVHVEALGQEEVVMNTYASEARVHMDDTDIDRFPVSKGDVLVLSLSVQQSGSLYEPEVVLTAFEPVLSVLADTEVGFVCRPDLEAFDGVVVQTGVAWPLRHSFIQGASASIMPASEARFYVQFREEGSECSTAITRDSEVVQETTGASCILQWSGERGDIGLHIDAFGSEMSLTYYAWA